MTRYYDSSAILKRFVREARSADVDRWLREQPAATSRLAFIEVASAAARKAREGAITPAALRRVLRALEMDAPHYLVLEVTPEVEATALRLLVAHPLRAGDAIHLASCLELARSLHRRTELVCFDDRLAAAARAEGVAVLGA